MKRAIILVVLLGLLGSTRGSTVDLDVSALRLSDQLQTVNRDYLTQVEQMNVVYTNKLGILHEEYKRKGDLDSLLLVQQVLDACRVNGRPVDPVAGSPVGVRRLYEGWKASAMRARSGRSARLKQLHLAYIDEMHTAKRQLTVEGKLEDAIRADEQRKLALAFLERLQKQPDEGLPELAVAAATDWKGRDLLQCRSLIWNGRPGAWEVQLLDRLKQEWRDQDLLLGIRDEDRFKMVKVVLPVPLAVGDRIVLEMQRALTIELIDIHHRERSAYINAGENADWQQIVIEVSAPGRVRFQVGGSVVEHQTVQLDEDGEKRVPVSVNVTGWFPGFAVLRDRDVQIRRITIEKNGATPP